jgi:hypothetical protein
MVGLNSVVAPKSSLTLITVNVISDRGQIAAPGMLPNGDIHAVLLVPNGDCEDACETRIEASLWGTAVTRSQATTQKNAAPPSRLDQLPYRFGLRHKFPAT